MNIHEHQAKELLREYNIPTPSGYVAFTTEEAIKVSKKLPGPIFVVKAQIHAGGRGKAGGVKVVKNLDELKNLPACLKLVSFNLSSLAINLE